VQRRTVLALEVLFVAALCGISLAAVWGHQKDDSPTLDEAYHLFAGSEYVADGTYWLNLEHPPLIKGLGAWALRGLRLLSPSLGRAPLDHSPHANYSRFLYGNRVPADRIVSAGRRPFPWLLAALVVLVYVITRQVFSRAAAPLAAGLIALEPNLVANAGVVHTDMGATLTMLAALAAGLLAARRRHVIWWLLAGFLLGLSLVTKFSAVLLVPLVLVLPLFSWMLESPRPPIAAARDRFVGAVAAVAVALLVVWGTYAASMRNMTSENARHAVHEFLSRRGADAKTLERFARLSDFVPPLGHYAAGLEGISLFSRNGRGANYFRGRISESGFPAYFPVAFLIKTSPALLVLVALLPFFARRELLSYQTLGFLLPAAGLLLMAMGSKFNIGVRHILPLYPLLVIPAAGAAARRLGPKALTALTAVLLASAGVSLASIHPYEFTYFNASVGGPARGIEWLSDSNLDWGQDLKRLSGFLRAKGWEKDTTIVAYSGVATNYYLPEARLLVSGESLRPGRYAVSALVETVGRPFVTILEGPGEGEHVAELVGRLRRYGRRLGTVGNSITIWELPPDPGETKTSEPQ
jgi:hypothetical protein